MRIKVMADYHCWPLWWDEPGRVGNIAPEALGLGDRLSAELLAWASIYDETLDPDDPIRSGFASPRQEELFHEEGERLAGSVAAELGRGSAVRYVRGA